MSDGIGREGGGKPEGCLLEGMLLLLLLLMMMRCGVFSLYTSSQKQTPADGGKLTDWNTCLCRILTLWVFSASFGFLPLVLGLLPFRPYCPNRSGVTSITVFSL